MTYHDSSGSEVKCCNHLTNNIRRAFLSTTETLADLAAETETAMATATSTSARETGFPSHAFDGLSCMVERLNTFTMALVREVDYRFNAFLPRRWDVVGGSYVFERAVMTNTILPETVVMVIVQYVDSTSCYSDNCWLCKSEHTSKISYMLPCCRNVLCVGCASAEHWERGVTHNNVGDITTFKCVRCSSYSDDDDY